MKKKKMHPLVAANPFFFSEKTFE